MFDINDYLIDQAGKDWGQLLSDWAALFPEDFTVWMVNRFGDVFVVFEDGTVHMLEVAVGTLTHVAMSREDFAEQMALGDNLNNWLLVPVVNFCVANGLRLGPDQCYGCKIPPVLGGQYSLDNIAPIDLAVHYAFAAQIWQQTKDMPEGTKIGSVTLE